MDEIDWLKSTKKALIFLAKVCGGFAIFIVITALLGISKNEWEYAKVMLFIALLIGVGLPAIVAICYLIIIIFLKILNSGRTVVNFDKEYIRDLPKHCSPAISSLIKEKGIDYVQMLENYIPYALALDEADAVEEFIKYNEKYRI